MQSKAWKHCDLRKARLELPRHMEDINKKIVLTLTIQGILEFLEMDYIHTKNTSQVKKNVN